VKELLLGVGNAVEVQEGTTGGSDLQVLTKIQPSSSTKKMVRRSSRIVRQKVGLRQLCLATPATLPQQLVPTVTTKIQSFLKSP